MHQQFTFFNVNYMKQSYTVYVSNQKNLLFTSLTGVKWCSLSLSLCLHFAEDKHVRYIMTVIVTNHVKTLYVV